MLGKKIVTYAEDEMLNKNVQYTGVKSSKLKT